MACKKVKLQFLEKRRARKVHYQKRERKLIKTTKELAELCGINVFCIAYGPYNAAPAVWPKNLDEAKRILLEYKCSENLQRQLHQEASLRKGVLRLERRNEVLEMENQMVKLISGQPIEQVPLADIDMLQWVIQERMRAIQHWIDVKEGSSGTNPDVDAFVGGTARGSFESQAGPSHYHHQP